MNNIQSVGFADLREVFPSFNEPSSFDNNLFVENTSEETSETSKTTSTQTEEPRPKIFG